MLIYIVVGLVCIVLALLVAAILYLIRTKQIKGKVAKCVAGRHLLPTPFFLSPMGFTLPHWTITSGSAAAGPAPWGDG